MLSAKVVYWFYCHILLHLVHLLDVTRRNLSFWPDVMCQELGAHILQNMAWVKTYEKESAFVRLVLYPVGKDSVSKQLHGVHIYFVAVHNQSHYLEPTRFYFLQHGDHQLMKLGASESFSKVVRCRNTKLCGQST